METSFRIGKCGDIHKNEGRLKSRHVTIVSRSPITSLGDDTHAVIPACFRRESLSDISGFRSSNLEHRISYDSYGLSF